MADVTGHPDSTSIAPEFSRDFRRLCQAAAVSDTRLHHSVVAGLLAAAMVFSDGPWREPADWQQAVEQLVGLALFESDVLEARDELAQRGDLVFDARQRSYTLSLSARAQTEERIAVGEALEQEVRREWLRQVEPELELVGSKTLWQCLLSYVGEALSQSGSDAVGLFQSTAAKTTTQDASPEAMLRSAMLQNGLKLDLYEPVASAVALFFDGRQKSRVRYVMELNDSMFSLLALQLDSSTQKLLLANLPELSIFVDSNVILGVLGAHTAPMSAISADLLRLLSAGKFPFKVYYHEKTLLELERTVGGIGERLLARSWPQAASRHLLNVPHTISSIEVRFHEINAETPTSPRAYLARFSSLPGLLSDYGLQIFREAVASAEEVRLRGALVAEYGDFVKEKRPGRPAKHYATLDHDVAVWLAAARRQAPRARGALFSGALILSADSLLRRFDRDYLARERGSGTWLVTFPDVLYQALRPFAAPSADFDATFTRVFAAPEFRGVGGDIGATAISVASYLATFADLPEATAAALLTNSMLMSRLKEVDEGSEQFARLIEEQLAQDNMVLYEEREALRKKTGALERASLDNAEALQRQIDLLPQQSPEAAQAALRDLVAKMAQPSFHAGMEISVSTTNNYNATGDMFNNDRTQVGAQGQQAHAHNMTQQQDQRQVSVDLRELSGDLGRLKEEMLRTASKPDHYGSVGAVQAAIDAAERRDSSSVTEHLRSAGRWVLETAKGVGVPVAELALKQALGLE